MPNVCSSQDKKSIKLLLSVKHGMKIFSWFSQSYNFIGIVLFIWT